MALAISNGPFTLFDHQTSTKTSSAITGISAAAGSIVVVFFGYQDNGTQASFTCTDNSGQTTTWSASQRQVGDLHKYSMFFWAYTAAGFSGATVTVSWPSSHAIDNGIAVVAITGANTAAPIGGGGTYTNSSSSTASITFTSTGTSSLVLMGVVDWTANTVGAVDGSSTSLAAWGTSGQGTFGLQRITSLVNAGSKTLSRTLGGTDEACASAIEIIAAAATFQPDEDHGGGPRLVWVDQSTAQVWG